MDVVAVGMVIVLPLSIVELVDGLVVVMVIGAVLVMIVLVIYIMGIQCQQR